MTKINVFLLTAATALVSIGVATIKDSLISGAVEIVLGIIAYIVYEKLPVS